MTSNVASTIMQDYTGDELREKVMAVLKTQFRPEFLNRIDEIIIFNQLGMDAIKKIVAIQLRYLHDRLAEREITISVSESVKELIASKGFDPVFGARPIKRMIQRMIEDPLSLKILNGEFNAGDEIKMDVSDGTVEFRK
jgi:ATP-dependent Clp protease ATP-binding subunit ClpB